MYTDLYFMLDNIYICAGKIPSNWSYLYHVIFVAREHRFDIYFV